MKYPAGVIARHRSSPFYPVQVPDLIGVKGRKYLDHTGMQLHRSIVDLVRYAALNQGVDFVASFMDSSNRRAELRSPAATGQVAAAAL